MLVPGVQAESQPTVTDPSDLTEFWRTTWAVWRSRALSPVNSNLAVLAVGSFEEFLETNGGVNDPRVSVFFTTHPPRPHEFLICLGLSSERMTMALTNQRLWMFDKPASEYMVLDLANVAAFRVASGWFQVYAVIKFKDGTERSYEKMADYPPDEAVRLALELGGGPGRWASPAATSGSATSPGSVRAEASDTFSFRVIVGFAFKPNTDLILSPERVRLGDRELLVTEVDWLLHQSFNGSYKGIKTSARREMKLGNSSTSLSFSLSENFLEKKATDVFPQILRLVLRYCGTRIVHKMIDTLASGGSFSVGKLRFTPTGVEIPKKKWLLIPDDHVAVPWARVRRIGAGQPLNVEVQDSGVVGDLDGPFLADSASQHEPRRNWFTHLPVIRPLRQLLAPHSDCYSTCYKEHVWTPNACLVDPLVQFMQEHAEISGGPWYVARNKQKVGPFVWSQLLRMVSAGMIQPEDMLLQEAGEKWSAAAAVPGLFPTAAPTGEI
jgi:hypothetical protein